MNKTTTKIGAGTLAVMIMAMSTACGASPATSPSVDAPVDAGSNAVQTLDVSKTGFPIVNETITLNGLCSKYELVTDWNTHKGLEWYAGQTNIDIKWDCTPENSFDERRNLLFASRNLPDFVIRANLKTQQELTYALAGQIIPIDGMIEEYAPNLAQLMKDDPGIRKALTAADGHIYSLPSISEADGRIASSWINKSQLDSMGVAMPVTIEDFKAALLALKNGDANGNNKPDEVGISGYKPSNAHVMASNSFLRLFYGSWGYGANSGIIDDTFIDVDDNGKIRFFPLDPEFKGMIQFFADLWSEGLIDKEIFAQDRNQLVAKMDDGRVAYVAEGNNFLWMGNNKTDFVQNTPLKVGNRTPVWVGVDPKVRDTGCFVITSANKHPEATLRWADYFLGEEGTALCRLGIKDVTYTVDEATGQYTLLPEFGKNPDLSVDEALSDYSLFQGGRMLMRVIPKVDQSAAVLPEMVANKDVLRPYLVADENILKSPRFTEDETIDISTYGTDIKAYTDEQLIKFITGAQPMTQWDNFTATLQKMNMDKYVATYQAAYDRWNQQ